MQLKPAGGECDRMRILQIINDRECGAVQKLAGTIEDGLTLHRFAVETAYLYPRGGLPVYHKFGFVLRMARRIWRGDFDAVIAYQSTAAILAGVVGRLAGCRLRVVHQTCPPREMPRLLRFLDTLAGTFGFYSANVIDSATSWAEFASYPARYRRAMILIARGLDAPAPTLNREIVRRHFDLPQSQPILLNVGRLTPQKNQDVLIRALTCLPQAHLVLAGAGPSEAVFHALAVTLGVDDRLHMLGPLPAGSETFGLAAVEAAMAGLPVVAADLPALRGALRADGAEPVTFVAPDDVEGWISAIGRALAAPSATQNATAFAHALGRKYSRQRMIESYLSLFEAHRRRAPTELSGLRPAAEKAQP
jgi:glycosyltransferase involved in cell wall biosynthesis